MDNSEKIAIKLIFNCILDKQEHELYEFHCKYKLSPMIILNAIRFLSENEIVIIEGENIMLTDSINNRKISIVNKLSKTMKPETLCKSMLDI